MSTPKEKPEDEKPPQPQWPGDKTLTPDDSDEDTKIPIVQ